MKLLILPGDGVGREVCNAALPVFEALKIGIDLNYGEIGWDCWCEEGNPVPQRTWKKIKESDAILLGATTSKGKKQALAELSPFLQGQDIPYVSPIIQLRQRLDLFVNIRPCELFYGISKPFRFCIIRENTEGLYAGIDRRGIPPELSSFIQHPNLQKSGVEESTFSIRLQTRFGLERIMRYAFAYARDHNFRRVTLADKPNVLRESGQFAADIFYAIAQEYPDLKADIHNVDALALWLTRRPEEFGVIVAENMFGDLLSDLGAGMMGGLGFAPSANLGNNIPYFEPVHGSAPKYVGQNKVNPSAMFLTIALLLQHFGWEEEATRISKAVKAIVKRGRVVTYDVGGSATTTNMAKTIIEEIVNPTQERQAHILCIGNELLSGRTANTNTTEFSKILIRAGFQTRFQSVCADQLSDIDHLMTQGLQSDVLIINGGLGPTGDDITRTAVARALNLTLEYREDSAVTVQSRLENIGLKMDEVSKRQAYFPRGARTIPNPNGTAQGFHLSYGECEIYVVPGPPRECVPMIEGLFQKLFLPSRKILIWRLLGMVESDLFTFVEDFFVKKEREVEIGTTWVYPYVDLSLTFKEKLPLALLEELRLELSSFLVDVEGISASERLIPHLSSHYTLVFEDQVTGGILERRFAQMHASSYNNGKERLEIKISSPQSLDYPFEGTVHLTCHVKGCPFFIQIPKARSEIIDYVFEFVSWSILRSICNE